MSGSAWYKRFPADFLHSTSSLTCEEKGAYTVLLDMMYERGGPIPDDPAWIARTCGCSQRKWTQRLRPRLIAAGKINIREDGTLSNGRMLYETHVSEERIKAAQEMGRRGGKANIAPIIRKDLFDYNDMASGKPAQPAAPLPIEPVEQPKASEINAVPIVRLNCAARDIPAPIAEPEADSGLSRVYRPDKPPINEPKPLENNELGQADSGLRKKVSKKDKEASLRSARARETAIRIPDDWHPTEGDLVYAKLHNIDGPRAAEEFWTYWSNCPDRDRKAWKKDWSKAFRNRILDNQDRRRFLLDRGRHISGAPKQSAWEQFQDDTGCDSVLFPRRKADNGPEIDGTAEPAPSLLLGIP